jgi:hypothetical protein
MSNRVWIYTISKALTDEQLQQLTLQGQSFVNQWTAHEQKLAAQFSIEKKRLIVVKVDEHVYGASGCSIDKLTRFVKQLETEYSIELLNRLLVAYKDKEAIEVVPTSSIKTLLQNQTITESTKIYNTAITSEAEQQTWLQDLKDTWLKKYLVVS